MTESETRNATEDTLGALRAEVANWRAEAEHLRVVVAEYGAEAERVGCGPHRAPRLPERGGRAESAGGH
jgi:hypothetical protein